ncbi:hydroxyacid dehydrogenase [Actomonas aquatica]|uniref:Hydroxyacid dehydrogenase n=1 Tax=Actomonas aquatica TaxID=2866162 RepID=A0ABZ1CD34_9BACT|nr:hydroxyacid dehydrogenase [Opitutus sp. WL0086]WRQ89592.1 hydroxyacid dehydrogenase [Opitutus sp. WL0086]
MSKIPCILLHIQPDQRPFYLPAEIEAAIGELTEKLVVWEHPGPDAEAFRDRMVELQPTVVVGGWGTPRLPLPMPASVKYVCYLGGSLKGIVGRAHLEAGLPVTNWGNSISRTVAEHAQFLVMAALRRARLWNVTMHDERGWGAERAETASLFGQRVGVHGFGFIARAFVELIAPYGCAVSSFAPWMDPALFAEHGVRTVDSLDALFAENDVVVGLAPLMDQTRDSIGEAQLRLLRPGGVFVNVGRGHVVDEAALARVAAEGRIHVGLDVYRDEPLPADSPLRGLSNVFLTPHMAGPTHDRRKDSAAFALANLRAFAAGEPLQAVVTPEIYDIST